MLLAICIDDDSIRNRFIVVLFHQQAVCSQLEHMIAIGQFCLAALNLHWNMKISGCVLDDVIRFACYAISLGEQCPSRTVKI